MNKPHNSFSVVECKIQASILLKALQSKDLRQTKLAVKRFKRLAEFLPLTTEEIMEADIKRKHALAVIASEKGFRSWQELKVQLPFIRGGYLNKWFANYSAAKSYLLAEGGFLLPFKNQFFICDADYIAQLGFDEEDNDWKLIAYDWAQPDNQEAAQRLYRKWLKIQRKNHE